jgi:MoaA/NifB/PqqE/SkfB family radical SAM enzyme
MHTVHRIIVILRKIADILIWKLCYPGKIKIDFMVFITGQKCTLRCRACGNFTPLLPQTFYSFDMISADLEKMLEVSKIYTLQIQGGEALIYPELVDLLKLLRTKKVRSVHIATNGTRQLTDEQIKAVRKLGATIRISDYQVNSKISAITDRLVEQCKKNRIQYRLYRFVSGDSNWMDMGGKDIKREDDDAKVKRTFDTCPFNICLTLEDGVIARCSRATVSHLIQNFIPAEYDLIESRAMSVSELGKRLKEYMRKPAFMEACRYCYGSRGKPIKAAEQY